MASLGTSFLSFLFLFKGAQKDLSLFPSILRGDHPSKEKTMSYIIKAVLGESLAIAEQEIERVEAAAAAKGIKVTRRATLSFEVGDGERQVTESVVDDLNLNWEKSAVYMEVETAVFGNCPTGSHD